MREGKILRVLTEGDRREKERGLTFLTFSSLAVFPSRYFPLFERPEQVTRGKEAQTERVANGGKESFREGSDLGTKHALQFKGRAQVVATAWRQGDR